MLPSSFPSNALFTVWAGANDIINGGTDLNAYAGNIISSLNILEGYGAQDILVMNLPDLGATPRLAGDSSYTALTMGFNLALNDALDVFEDDYNGNLFRVDVFSFMADIGSNFDNSTDAKLNSDGTQNPGSYLFWDDLHPTTQAHELLADYSEASVPIPGAVWLFGSGIICILSASSKRKKTEE